MKNRSMRYHFTANWLYRQITWIVFQIMSRRTAENLASVFGLWLTLMPLSLWFAWSKEAFVWIVLSGIVSGALFICLGIAVSPEGKSKGFEEWKRLVKAYDLRKRQDERRPDWWDMR